LSAFPGLIVKDNYWRWPQRNLAGNAIDFFVQVLELGAVLPRRHAPDHRTVKKQIKRPPAAAAPYDASSAKSSSMVKKSVGTTPVWKADGTAVA